MKVKVKQSFVGSPEEVEKYGGGIPTHLQDREDKMSKAEKQAFGGKINAGTEMDVSEQRARELADLGLITGLTPSDIPVKEKSEAPAAKEKKVITENVKEKAETKVIPTAKKK